MLARPPPAADSPSGTRPVEPAQRHARKPQPARRLPRHRQLEVATEAQGALHGYRTTEDAVLREPNAAGLASRSQLPLRVAVARVWNLDPRVGPRKRGNKLAFDYFCVDRLKEVPATLATSLASSGASRRHGQRGLWVQRVACGSARAGI
jgi:hypothetical protein